MTFPVKEKTFEAFDFLVAVLLNVGRFYPKRTTPHRSELEFYTLPREFVKEHHDKSTSWERLRLRGLSLDAYWNETGFEQIRGGPRYPLSGSVLKETFAPSHYPATKWQC